MSELANCIFEREQALKENFNLKVEVAKLQRRFDQLESRYKESIAERDELQRKYEGLGKDYEQLYMDHTNLLNDGKDLFLKKQNHGLAEQVVELQRKLEESQSNLLKQIYQFTTLKSHQEKTNYAFDEAISQRDAALEKCRVYEEALRDLIKNEGYGTDGNEHWDNARRALEGK